MTDHMTYVLRVQMTLMGMGVALIAAQLRGELLGFITRYKLRMKLNALVFSIVSVVVSCPFFCGDKSEVRYSIYSPDIHCFPGKM